MIAQTASEMSGIFQNIRILAAAGAAGIYHHGTTTDNLWHEGKIDTVQDYVSCMRDSGVQVGLGTHIPEVIEYAEENIKPTDALVVGMFPGDIDQITLNVGYALEKDPVREYIEDSSCVPIMRST